jgi:hypothetical protein
VDEGKAYLILLRCPFGVIRIFLKHNRHHEWTVAKKQMTVTDLPVMGIGLASKKYR